ncbi:kinase-like domain-containing protein [Entophlyctis helioformis]|nr:kinase-like domain-containing protein [Entophlyctis helioformis]
MAGGHGSTLSSAPSMSSSDGLAQVPIKQEVPIQGDSIKRNKLNNGGYDDENDDYIVRDGEVWNGRFEVLKLLGSGSFGQVVHAYDRETKEDVAIKIIKNRRSFSNQAQIEIRLLKLINHRDPDNSNCVVHIKEHFIHRNHLCMVYELLSLNLYDLLRRGRFTGLPLSLIRKFTAQILTGLLFLSRQDVQIIHCDLKPENIMLKSPKESRIKIIDFGSSCLSNEKAYTYIQSRFYRSPEVILGHSYTCAIDMWSLGCILVELLTGRPIFPGTNEREQMCRICDVLGIPAASFLAKSPPDRLARVFALVRDTEYRLVPSKGFQPSSPHRSLARILRDAFDVAAGYQDRPVVSDADQDTFIDFVERVLAIDPAERLTPHEALQHPFVASLGDGQPMVSRAANTDLRSSPAALSAGSVPLAGGSVSGGMAI